MGKYITLLVVISFLLACQTDPPRPNIILIMTDDQGWFDAGFNGNNKIKTPHMDSLAYKGIIFDRFYSASAVCSPTRASVLTGRNPLRMNIPTANSGHMPQDEITLPELLKEQGYATAHFGKWHLGTLTRDSLDSNRGGRKNNWNDHTLPTEHGYAEFFATEAKVPTWDPMIYPLTFQDGEGMRFGWRSRGPEDSTAYFGTAYWETGGKRVSSNLEGDDSRIIIDRVIPFITTSVEHQKPFFTTIWFHAPHLPVVTDSTHRELYTGMSVEEQIYYGTISALDEQIGRLTATLQDLGIENETMIWYCSDNGPERGTPGSAGKLKGIKRSLYEGGVRVPAFVVWPDEFQGGQRTEVPAITSDYLPTLIELLQISYPGERPLDGQSLKPQLYQNQEREKPIGFIFSNQISWVNTKYKLYSPDKGETFELYDLINDPSENEDIAGEKPDIVSKMKRELMDWLTSVKKDQDSLIGQ